MEVGAGTSGFTRQVLDRLDRNTYESLLCWMTQAWSGFCAVEVSASMGGFTRQVLDRLDHNAYDSLLCWLTQAPGGFCAVEVGAGTGGFTRQVLDRLDRNATTELVRYTATDVTPSFRQALLAGLASPKLAFQVRSPRG